MTASRRLMWAALAAAALTWAAVAVLTTRTEPAVARAPTAARVVEPAPPGDAPMSAEAGEPVSADAGELVPSAADAIIDREPVRAWAVGSAGEVPDAELERGTSSLGLRLVSDTTGEPVEMNVRLWRLGVAASGAWSFGDEGRVSLNVPTQGARVDGLPHGSYRLQCLELRRGAADPPEFVVPVGASEQVLRVANCRTFTLRARIVDEAGAAISAAVRQLSGGGFSSAWPRHLPKWANARRTRPDDDLEEYFGEVPWGGSGCGVSNAERVAVRTGADAAFELGSHRECSDTGRSESSRFTYRGDGRGDVVVSFDNAIGVDTTFVGVAPRLDVLVAHVTRPDGTPVDLAAAKVTAVCIAPRMPWDPPADAWRTVPVQVTIQCDGFEPMKFVWTANTADAPHVLVPK